MYTLCSKLPQFLPTFISVLPGLQYLFPGLEELPGPLLTVSQILAIDILTDVWTSIAYAMQPSEDNLMARMPRHPKIAPLMDATLLVYSYLWIGILQSLGCLLCSVMLFYPMWTLLTQGATDAWVQEFGPQKEISSTADLHKLTVRSVYAQGTTIYYWALVVGQIAAAYATTTIRQSLVDYGIPNRALNWLILLEIATGLLIIYSGAGNFAFQTESVSALDIIWPLFVVFIPILVAEELRKAFVRRKNDQINDDEMLRAKAMRLKSMARMSLTAADFQHPAANANLSRRLSRGNNVLGGGPNNLGSDFENYTSPENYNVLARGEQPTSMHQQQYPNEHDLMFDQRSPHDPSRNELLQLQSQHEQDLLTFEAEQAMARPRSMSMWDLNPVSDALTTPSRTNSQRNERNVVATNEKVFGHDPDIL